MMASSNNNKTLNMLLSTENDLYSLIGFLKKNIDEVKEGIYPLSLEELGTAEAYYEINPSVALHQIIVRVYVKIFGLFYLLAEGTVSDKVYGPKPEVAWKLVIKLPKIQSSANGNNMGSSIHEMGLPPDSLPKKFFKYNKGLGSKEPPLAASPDTDTEMIASLNELEIKEGENSSEVEHLSKLIYHQEELLQKAIQRIENLENLAKLSEAKIHAMREFINFQKHIMNVTTSSLNTNGMYLLQDI